MSSLKYFDCYYSEKHNPSFSSSLLDFFEDQIRSRLPEIGEVLELGCGSYSHFEEIQNFSASITAIDFSAQAIAKAPKSSIVYKVSNISDSEFFPASFYHLIFDAHCLNCLSQKDERQKALMNIANALKEGGLFTCELMATPSHLLQEEHVQIPYKIVQTAYEWEMELKSSGLKILYFMIIKESQFEALGHEGKTNCDVLRVILQK